MSTSEVRPPMETEALPERLLPGRLGHRAIEQRIAADPDGVIDDVQKLHRDAREHKRLANWHRRRAAIAWNSFNEFKSRLEALGIQVVVETTPQQSPMPKGGTSERSERHAGN